MANLLQRAFQSLTRAAPEALYPQQGGGTWFSFGSGQGRKGHLNLTAQQQLATQWGWVYRAVTQKADDIALLAVSAETRQGKKWQQAPDHPLQNLMDAPNPWTTGFEFRHLSQQHLELTGRVAWLVVEGRDGVPAELHTLYPHLLDPLPDPTNYLVGWRYRSLSGQQLNFPNYDPLRPAPDGVSVLALHIPHPSNPYRPNSPAAAAADAIDLDSEIKSFARFYYQNNTMLGGVLETDAIWPGPDKSRAMMTEFNEAFQGVMNAGKTAYLWQGLKYKSITPALKDLDFTNLTQATKQDIFDHFGVPLSIIGTAEKGALGGNAVDSERHKYQRHSLLPASVRLSSLYQKLARRYGVDVWASVENPVEENLEEKRKAWQSDLERGVLSRKEYRDLVGYEPDTQPDVYILGNSYTVRDTLLPVTPPQLEPPVPDVPPPDPEAERRLQNALRGHFASEYRRLRNGATLETLEPEFDEELTLLAPGLDIERVRRLRRWAMKRGGLVNCYELMKSDLSKRFAKEATNVRTLHAPEN